MSIVTLARLGAPAAVLGLVLVPSGRASAHVTITPSTTVAGAYTVGTVALSHGCDGSATRRVAIAIPQQILSVKPTRTPFWDVRVVRTRLAAPQRDAHGNEVTERVSEIVYTTRTPLPDGVRDTFDLSFQVPDAAGETLYFPAVQTCRRGETAWTQVPAEGQDPEELETPAPSFVVTDPGPGVIQEPTARAAAAEPVRRSAAPSSEGADLTGVAGMAAGLLGLLVGGYALVQVRRRA